MNKLEIIDINRLIKADWNYKTDGTDEQINKLMESIKYDNSAGVLAVRILNDKLEVIDGNHRLEALRRLGWPQVQVENFGEIPKSKAIVISRRRNHVWFDDDMMALSELFKNDVIQDINADELKKILPDTPQEIDNLLNFASFDWETPVQKEHSDAPQDKTIKITVSPEVYEIWQQWVKHCAEQTDYKSESQAFEYAIIEAQNGQK